MPREVSIADARDSLTKLIKRAEAGEAIRLTRRGRTVAVLVSAEVYGQLARPVPNFLERYEAFRRAHDLEALGIDTTVFDEARDRAPGREVAL